ncbi:MAG: DsbA family protein [Candidatus Magasanikbacteria bacterium]|nr:DsbA family protein [Candidatus Magasanikbacteria bacterium]MCA9389102.1 DsbA family protein [Candidatus Magasanikbacteria bacterium]
MENHRMVWIAIGGLVVLFALASLEFLVRSTSYFPAGSKPALTFLQPSNDAKLPPNRETDPWTGSSSTNAVVVTIFGDMTDLSTKSLEPAVVAIINEIPDTRIVWRDLILASDNPSAILAAAAGRCANDQQRFWEFRGLVMAATGDLTVDRLQEYARTAGMNVSGFNTCLATGKDAAIIQQDNALAAQYNIGSSPTIFIESKVMPQDISVNSLRWEVFKARLKK